MSRGNSARTQGFLFRMRPYKFLITLAAIALFGAGFAYLIAPRPETVNQPSEAVSRSPQEEAETRETVETLSESQPEASAVSNAEANDVPVVQKQRYTIPVLSETTVFRAMEAYAETNAEFTFSVREFSGLGFFIEEIGGLKNRDGFYWTLFINNTLSEKGASTVNANPGDVVEWRYQKGI